MLAEGGSWVLSIYIVSKSFKGTVAYICDTARNLLNKLNFFGGLLQNIMKVLSKVLKLTGGAFLST